MPTSPGGELWISQADLSKRIYQGSHEIVSALRR
jgi:hypothetical protein